MQGTFQEVTTSSADYARMLVPVKEESTDEPSEIEESSTQRQRSYSRSRSKISRKNSIVSQRTQRVNYLKIFFNRN